MSELAYVIADVFTDRPLEGNPVAVFPDAPGLQTEVMQRLARELNLSETSRCGESQAAPPTERWISRSRAASTSPTRKS